MMSPGLSPSPSSLVIVKVPPPSSGTIACRAARNQTASMPKQTYMLQLDLAHLIPGFFLRKGRHNQL